MTQTPDLRESLASYVESLSEWRRTRYDDDLRDPRHLRSARGLREFAEYVRGLPAGDQRMAGLARFTADGEVFAPGQQTSYELGRFRFHDEHATLDGLLETLIELAETDARERGRFGGKQAPGDDPWS